MSYSMDRFTDNVSHQLISKLEDLIIESLPEKFDMAKPYAINVISSRLSIVVDRYGWSTYSYKNKPFLKIAPYEFNEKFDDKRMSHSLVAEFKYIKL